MKDQLLQKVKEAVLRIEPAAEIILYGSRARTDFRETSDWDFLILVDGLVDAARTDLIRSVVYDIELEEDQILNSIVRSRQEWCNSKLSIVPLHVNIEREGIRV